MSINPLKNLSIKKKLLLPNILYFILLSVVIIIFFSSGSLIKNLSEEQKKYISLSNNVRNTAYNIQAYLNKEITYENLKQKFDKLTDKNETLLADNFSIIWEKLNMYKKLIKKYGNQQRN